MALSYALAIVLPIVATFFLALQPARGLRLPAAAWPIMVNRLFRLMGLNGKAVLPMVLGLGCDTMATMTTRILETRKERVVTTLLLALAVPCSAQLGVLLAMMASLSLAGALVWLGADGGGVCAVGWLPARLFPGDASDFILEIPPMRRPQLGNVVVKTLARLDWYLREVIPLFLVGTAALFVLDRIGALGGAVARSASRWSPAGWGCRRRPPTRSWSASCAATSAPSTCSTPPPAPTPCCRRTRCWWPWSPSPCSCPASPTSS